ncbi:hypothetical protein PanWU01x14_047720 [Parasponia andersonii]|uniref:Integrase zinc-binding domain-containing protein n=1 Tax=Parasponia andersonii TaxID=3476 RepID=A0A2P5DN51_PARAD|nr:hypothetical protein PanWU01x14_047720 [Parasponia andersonii]
MGAKARFSSFDIEQIPREMNQKADELAKSASIGRMTGHAEILLEGENTRDPLETSACHVFATDSADEGWMKPITQYLVLGNLPADPQEARSIRLKAVRYSMVGGRLSRRSMMGPMLRCVGPIEGQKLMEDIHEGAYGNHSGGHSLTHKALMTGYFWPYMMTKVAQFVKKCDKCQRFAPHEAPTRRGTSFEHNSLAIR